MFVLYFNLKYFAIGVFNYLTHDRFGNEKQVIEVSTTFNKESVLAINIINFLILLFNILWYLIFLNGNY